MATKQAEKLVNTIRHGDCIAGLNSLKAGSIDLAFADPPFNIGYDYDVYDDKQEHNEYLKWSRDWIAAVYRALKPDGTFWLAIGDEYAAELKVASQDVGFHSRSWVVWYYTFGVNCKAKFSRSHAHLFYFVKDPQHFTWRGDDLENRIPSARQLVYADARANPRGRLPDDTWVLRPQDLADCFTPDEDTWYFPRVAGTFKERAGFHGCQMPEQLLGRIVRCCSNDNDIVLDPFSGSATTVAVAKKLGRRYLAFDLSEDYVRRGLARLETVRVGDPLEGAAEPTLSAPATPAGGLPRKQRASQSKDNVVRDDSAAMAKAAKMFTDRLLQAFGEVYDGYSLDRVIADPLLNQQLISACEDKNIAGEARAWNHALFGMRKAGLLKQFPTTKKTEIAWADSEDYLFASEIAWRQMIDSGSVTLDAILADPILAKEFDRIAELWAPGFTPFQYRWAAIKLRKTTKELRVRAQLLTHTPLGEEFELNKTGIAQLPESSGVYVVNSTAKHQPLYAGQAENLRQRLQIQFGSKTRRLWQNYSSTLTARFFRTECDLIERMAYQRRLVALHTPIFNLPESKLKSGDSMDSSFVSGSL